MTQRNVVILLKTMAEFGSLDALELIATRAGVAQLKLAVVTAILGVLLGLEAR